MKRRVKSRPYRSDLRARRASDTREAILLSAYAAFTTRGYSATTMADVASAAGVAVDTIYATVGTKTALLRLLIDTAISGAAAVDAPERDYVRHIEAAGSAAEKLSLYVDAITGIVPRLSPLLSAIRTAGDADATALWSGISARRAANMRLFAASLRRTGEIRSDLDDATIADTVWTLCAPETYELLVYTGGWSPAKYATWLRDALERLLLERSTRPPAAPARSVRRSKKGDTNSKTI